MAGSGFAQDRYGPVGNETLWAVATKVNAGRSSSVAQMAWALYRANPQAFDGSPDKMRPSAVLSVPAAAFVNEITAAQAYAYVTGRSAPAAAAAPVPAPTVTAQPRPAATVPLAVAPVSEGPVTMPLASTAFAGSTEQRAAVAMRQSGRSAEDLYQYLAPLEDRYAGDVDYDYLLGSAAHDSGNYSQAIFVLQRAVATKPGFAGARMELARAYFAQGDNESARREFTALEKDNPPPQARRAIKEYQAAIDRRAAVYESQLGGYAELATGYDSNANGSPDLQSFLGIPLDERNQATASTYYSLDAGGLVSYPFAPGWRLLGTGNASYRSNPDATFVDSQVLRLGGAVEWRPNQYEFSLRPSYGMSLLDGEDNNTVIAVDLAATRHFERAQLSLNLRSGQTRYTEGLEVLDVDTLLYGLAGSYTTPRVQYLGAVTAGTDDAVEPGSQFGRDLAGLRAGAIVGLGRGNGLLASVAMLSADYDQPPFGQARSDDQLIGTLGFDWGGWRALGWVVRAQLSYVSNSSTVALYEYDRVDLGVSLRREFK
ncbi:MAG: FimV/HubP family polar landmark protein [Gammaproteobacteria bacterium]